MKNNNYNLLISLLPPFLLSVPYLFFFFDLPVVFIQQTKKMLRHLSKITASTFKYTSSLFTQYNQNEQITPILIQSWLKDMQIGLVRKRFRYVCNMLGG
jgi:hypothetical protein